MELAFRPFHVSDQFNGWLTELFQRHVAQEAEEAGVTLPILPQRQISPVESAIDDVREHLHGLQVAFPDKSTRIAACVLLKESLRQLEREAAWYGYEPLSRVALVLRYVLTHNYIEDFDDREFAGFLEAAKQVTEVLPDEANPHECELALFKVRLSWLPTIAEVDDGETNDHQGEE